MHHRSIFTHFRKADQVEVYKCTREPRNSFKCLKTVKTNKKMSDKTPRKCKKMSSKSSRNVMKSSNRTVHTHLSLSSIFEASPSFRSFVTKVLG